MPGTAATVGSKEQIPSPGVGDLAGHLASHQAFRKKKKETQNLGVSEQKVKPVLAPPPPPDCQAHTPQVVSVGPKKVSN